MLVLVSSGVNDHDSGNVGPYFSGCGWYWNLGWSSNWILGLNQQLSCFSSFPYSVNLFTHKES